MSVGFYKGFSVNIDALFCSLSPLRIAELIRSAQRAVCYAAPGIQLDLAQAMVETVGRLGKEMLTVSLDFDDRVMRMGYGDIGAVTLLLGAGISVNSSPGLRTALVVVDNEGIYRTLLVDTSSFRATVRQATQLSKSRHDPS